MKIMLVNHYAGSVYHGMEYRPYYMAREWVNRGHEVVIVGASYSHLRKTNPAPDKSFEEERIDGITYVWIRTPEYRGNHLGRIFNILSFVSKLWLHTGKLSRKYRPDAVIASSTYPLDIYPCARIAKKSGAGLFFEIHDLWPLTPVEIGKMSPKHPYIMLLQAAENYAFKHAKKIISILPGAHEYIQTRGYDAGKCVHIPNGVIIAEAGQAEDTESLQIQKLRELKQKGCFLVGYTGNHSAANGLETLVEAARMTKNARVQYVFIGSGNEKESLMKDAEGSGNVHFLDPVLKGQMIAVLRLLDVAYMGLRNEPLFRFGVSPNKLFDYMLAARPIIYAVSAYNDPVKDACCGVSVLPGDPEAVWNAVMELLDKTPEERTELGENGRRYVVAHHDYPVLAEQFVKALEIS